MAQCRRCGAEIVWIKTKAGKSMPCNAERKYYRRGNGNMIFVTESGEVCTGGETPYDEYSNNLDCLGHISLCATCPNANEHRRK